MTNNDIYNLVDSIGGLQQKGQLIEIHEFNRMLSKANIYKFKKELGMNEDFFRGQPNSRTAYEVQQRVTDTLRLFKTSTTLTVTAGLASIPSNYFYVTGMNYDNAGALKTLEILTDAQWGERSGKTIMASSLNNPICRFLSSTIEFKPSAIGSVQWTYLRLPSTPQAVYKEQNGILVYDTINSTELEWDDVAKYDIVSLILKDIGVAVDPASVSQYAENVINQGV